MKKYKKIALIIIILIVPIIFGILLYSKKYPNKNAYLKYLEQRYGEKFVIDDEITNYDEINTEELLRGVYYKEIDKSYFKAYRFHLKKDSTSHFIVAYGKFKVEVWEMFKTKIFVDNYNGDIKLNN